MTRATEDYRCLPRRRQIQQATPSALTRFIVPTGEPADELGKIRVDLSASPQNLALDLIVAPLCAATLVNQLRWFLGWDSAEIGQASTRMLRTWGRVTAVPGVIADPATDA
jgi:hypothetical protein